MKKYLTLLLLGLLTITTPVAVSARSAQKLVPAGHWVYDAITAVSLEQGLVNFAINAPLTIEELKTYLYEVDYDKLSSAGRIQFDRVSAWFKEEAPLSFTSDVFTLGVEPSLNPEFFYKTNDDIDWVWDRYSRNHVVETPVTLDCGDLFTFEMDLYGGQTRGMSLHNDNYSNIPLLAEQVDVNFPDTGYFSTGKKLSEKSGVSFRLGSGSFSVGRTSTPSIIWSECLTGLAYAQFDAYSPDLKYTATAAQYSVDKYFYSHEIEGRLFDRLTLSFMEAMIVYAPLELRYLNPFTIFHGMAPWNDYAHNSGTAETNTGAYLCINANWTPFNGVRLYGLYAMTQYQTPYELELCPDDCTPNGIGFQLGSEVYKPLRDGYFHFNIEGYYAQPYLWIKESPNWSFVRTYRENIGDQAIFYEWIGSPFGPDTIAGEITFGYEKPQSYKIDFTYLFMAKGEMSDTKVFYADGLDWGGHDTWVGDDDDAEDLTSWCYPDPNLHGQKEAKRRQSLTTPTGTPEYVSRISSRITMYPESWLKVTMQPAYVFIFNHNNEEGEFAQGFEIALAFAFTLSK